MTGNLYQYDYGQKLIIYGAVLPETYEVHFSNEQYGSSKTVLGDSTGVVIPDEYLTSGDNIHVWIYLHDGDADGETEYHGIINVIKRAKPTDQEPTPVQQDVITQAIAALNAGAARAETAADEAEAAADSLKGATAGAVTLPEGSAATAELSVNDGVFAFDFGIPVGATGPQGPRGIQGDRGEKGETGATPDMSIGTVQTLPAGSQATAQISGTAEQPVLSLGIPKGDPGSVPIDDAAGAGDTTKVWSADKSAGEVSVVKNAFNGLPTEETGQELLDKETGNAGLTETALAVIGLLFDRMPQNETATDIYYSLLLENERLLAIYEIWEAERSA